MQACEFPAESVRTPSGCRRGPGWTTLIARAGHDGMLRRKYRPDASLAEQTQNAIAGMMDEAGGDVGGGQRTAAPDWGTVKDPVAWVSAAWFTRACNPIPAGLPA